jgi:hypothetical protein
VRTCKTTAEGRKLGARKLCIEQRKEKRLKEENIQGQRTKPYPKEGNKDNREERHGGNTDRDSERFDDGTTSKGNRREREREIISKHRRGEKKHVAATREIYLVVEAIVFFVLIEGRHGVSLSLSLALSALLWMRLRKVQPKQEQRDPEEDLRLASFRACLLLPLPLLILPSSVLL